MKLSAPSFGLYFVSTLMILLIILSRYFNIDIPILTPIVAQNPFEATVVSWAILFAGVTFNL